ncbi:MAG: S41 family peptidase [bacterium]|nr:S41 family peptidase [bacterium]
MKKTLLSFVLLFALVNVRGQNTIITKESYSVEELKNDFKILRASLEEAHPGIYRYNSKTKMDSVFNSTEASITKPMGEREFKILISKVVNQIGCGHTKVVAPKPDQDKLDEGHTAIPFQPYYSDGKLYVLRNFSTLTDSDFLGANILSINGHSTSDILNKMFSIFPSDGNNMTHKYRNLAAPRNLTRYFYYLYGYNESYEVVYTSQNDSISKKVTLPGLLFDDLISIREKKYASTYLATPVEFKLFDDKKTAYLQIGTFDEKSLRKSKINFQKFLKTTFKTIESNHIQNIILDLRFNGGGTDELGKLLFSYFIDREFDYYASLTMNKNKYEFFKYTSRPDASAPKGMLKANQNGTFDNIQSPNAGKQKSSLPTFKGKIYVLINGGCFSTTCEALSMLHSYTNSVFIGEESGGGYYGNTSGPTPDMTLPNTKIRIEIPLMKYVMAVKEYSYQDRGLIPNHEVIPSISDKILGVDRELEFAKKLIDQ